MLILPVRAASSEETVNQEKTTAAERVKDRGGERTFWENVHPLASVELVQYKIHASLVNAVTFAEHNMTRSVGLL